MRRYLARTNGLSAPAGAERVSYQAADLIAVATARGTPSSIGRLMSRDHSFHEPKWILTFLMPASLSAMSVLDARAPLKQ
jgi:hypothetical protein